MYLYIVLFIVYHTTSSVGKYFTNTAILDAVMDVIVYVIAAISQQPDSAKVKLLSPIINK